MRKHVRALGVAILALLVLASATPAAAQFPCPEQARINWRQFEGPTITVIYQRSYLALVISGEGGWTA